MGVTKETTFVWGGHGELKKTHTAVNTLFKTLKGSQVQGVLTDVRSLYWSEPVQICTVPFYMCGEDE